MERPRICEILDKEVETPFYFRGKPDYKWYKYKISDDGLLLCSDGGIGGRKEKWTAAGLMDLCEMINRGIPRWIEEDVETAKAIRLLIPLADKIGWDGGVKAVLGEFEDKVLLDLPPKFFPSLRRGETVRLDDILKGGCDAD